MTSCKKTRVREQRPDMAGNARHRHRARRPAARSRQQRRLPGARLAAVLAAVLVTGCAAGAASLHPAAAGERPASGTAVPAGSLVRVPHPDYARPASVAAAFYIAWGSADAVHDCGTRSAP